MRRKSYAAGWTIDGKAIISKFDELSAYDPLSNNIVKKVKTYGLSGEEFDASMKSINAIQKTNISPNGTKEIFYHNDFIGVRDLTGKHQKYLLRNIRRS